MQAIALVICIALGCAHLVDRGRTPHATSSYFGSVTTSHRLRGSLALIEVVCGFALLFTA